MYYVVKFIEILLYMLIKALCVCGTLFIHTAFWGWRHWFSIFM